jgi:hypothetical protein
MYSNNVSFSLKGGKDVMVNVGVYRKPSGEQGVRGRGRWVGILLRYWRISA